MKHLTVVVFASSGFLVTGCATSRSPQSAVSTPATPAATPVITSASAPSMIGAGTSLIVRTNETISTAQDTPGKTYAAEITNDIVDQGGSMLVPKGSPVQITVVAAPTGGPAAPDLQLALLSMTVKGKTYQVTSATADAGAIAGSRAQSTTAPGKPRSGALLGTGTGAAQVMTRGKEVRIPAKSSITFQLEQTIQLVGYTP
jgi:hypothetical protein